jgi:diaminopimelate decarboxylase
VAIQHARRLFNKGLEYGYRMNLLDIGGGFPAEDTAEVSFAEVHTYLFTDAYL